jgi:hypothetical protein
VKHAWQVGALPLNLPRAPCPDAGRLTVAPGRSHSPKVECEPAQGAVTTGRSGGRSRLLSRRSLRVEGRVRRAAFAVFFRRIRRARGSLRRVTEVCDSSALPRARRAAVAAPALIPSWQARLSAFGVLLGRTGLELEADERLVAHDPGVVPRLDDIRLPGGQVLLGPVLVRDVQPS